MNTSYLPYDEWLLPLDPQWAAGRYMDESEELGSASWPQGHQIPMNVVSSGFVQGLSAQEVTTEPLSGMGAGFSPVYGVRNHTTQAHLRMPMALGGYAQGPAPLTSQADLWLGHQTHSWPLRTAHNAAHPVPVPIRSNRYGPYRHTETSASQDLQPASWRPAEARPIQGNTNKYNNGHIGNHLPKEHPFAESIPVSIAGPDASAWPADTQAAHSNEVSPRRGGKATRARKGKLHGEGPHICKLDGKVFRHRGDLVRHRKTKPGHVEYQGPVICVCGQEFSRRDGLYTHLKGTRCRRPLFS